MSRDYHAKIYPPQSIHQEDTSQLLASDVYFIGAYGDDNLLAIGAVKTCSRGFASRAGENTEPDYGEIKNLFVDTRFRRQGLSHLLMQALEQYLIDKNIPLCRLETGVKQPESLALYHNLGYRDRGPYGDYEDDALSVYMEKELPLR